VNFPRLLVVAGAFAATVSSPAEEGVAQGLNNEPSIAIETAWTSGYMALGGGLTKAVPKNAERVEKHERVETAAAPHRVRHKRRVHTARRLYDPQGPVKLVSETLDHTGFNISNLGAPHGP
jgi:hypothetical protein